MYKIEKVDLNKMTKIKNVEFVKGVSKKNSYPWYRIDLVFELPDGREYPIRHFLTNSDLFILNIPDDKWKVNQ